MVRKVYSSEISSDFNTESVRLFSLSFFLVLQAFLSHVVVHDFLSVFWRSKTGKKAGEKKTPNT